MASDITFKSLRPLQYRAIVSGGRTSLDTVMGVVRSLIDAGANVNEEFNCRTIYSLFDHYSGPESYTIFDLGVLTGSIETVNMLIAAGSHMTNLLVEHAIQVRSLDILNRLLDAGALVSENAAVLATGCQQRYLQTLLAKKENTWIKGAALLEAIEFGRMSIIEYLFQDGTFTCRDISHMSAKLTHALQICCKLGQIDILDIILRNSLKCQFSLSPWFGHSLYYSILAGRGELIDFLLSAGADVNAMGPKGETPLVAAIMQRNTTTFGRLMDMGAILNPKAPLFTSCSRVHGVSGDALVAAIQYDDAVMVNRLLEMGADIEAFGTISHKNYGDDPCFCTRPLTAAIMARNLDLVNYLIRRGAKINNPPDAPEHARSRMTPLGGMERIEQSRITPLAAAIQIQDYKMVDVILREGANPYDDRAIMAARYSTAVRMVLLRAMNSSHQLSNIECIGTALNMATQIHDLHVMKAILCGPLRDMKLGLRLSVALIHDVMLSTDACDTVRMLLNFGADPNTICPSDSMNTICSCGPITGRSALDMVARGLGFPQLIKILLEAGAEADTSTLFGRRYSPVQSAVKKGNHQVAQILLGYGSNPNSVSIPSSVLIRGENREDDYRTPIQIAVQHQDMNMIRILLQYKADINGIFVEEGEANSNKYRKDYLPRTPLQEASLKGNKEIVELLLQHGADVNSPPIMRGGATALQYAAMQGFLGIAYLLLEHDADVNAAPAKTDGRTALEGAAEYGRVDMVQLLLNAGANIFGDGQAQYENAIRRASGNGHHAIRRMLEKHYADRE